MAGEVRFRNPRFDPVPFLKSVGIMVAQEIDKIFADLDKRKNLAFYRSRKRQMHGDRAVLKLRPKDSRRVEQFKSGIDPDPLLGFGHARPAADGGGPSPHEPVNERRF